MPIKSLPQEWLWCETWCDDNSKAKAKTIDLCNNPKTKEPKLTAARRILPEWEGYDNEIKELMKLHDELREINKISKNENENDENLSKITRKADVDSSSKSEHSANSHIEL